MALDIPPTPTVEATSLSSVLELATNPPSQPTSIQPGTAPLVLYIARVPGSRDVFLTPIKPREKVVTASDVQSSLYYVHYNCSTEDYHQSNDPTSKPSSVNTDAGNLPTISEPQSPTRKAVPPPLPRRPAPPVSTPYPLDNDDEKPTLPPRPGSLRQKVPRKPLLPIRSPMREREVDLPVLPPRPLPPTPPQEEEEGEPESPSLHEDNIRLLRRESHTNEMNNPYVRDYPTHPETLKQQALDSLPDPGTLTLIRRDPGSNEQWNVGMIHDPPIQEVSSSSLLVLTAKRRTKKGGAPLWLDITNPGYTQFLINPSHTDSRVSLSTTSSSEESEQTPEGVFRRRLYMPGSKFGEHGYGQNGPGNRKHGSASSASGVSEMPSTMRGARHSVDLGSLSGTPRSSDRRSKGYTFTSPWEGRCEFTTGATGTSLKCRHYFPTQHGAGISGYGDGGVVVEVSELRFNLPTSAKSTPTPTSSYFSHRPHFFHSHSEDGSDSPTIVLDGDGRIDLSLGQERAGGGFGGKQAKLGKLIIEPAGFGMLDLLVAANLGLWWRAWERV